MSTPLIGALRESNPLMRSTTLVVLIAFVTLLVQPTIAAATDTTPVPTTTTTSTSAEAQYSKTLQRIEDKLARLDDKLTNQLDGTLERNDLKQLEQTLKQLDQTVRQGFHQVEQHITDKHLASVIMQRHQAMVANYQAEYQALIDELDAIDAATDDSQRKQHAQAALNRLKQKKNKRSHQPFDPKSLPFQSTKNKARPPKETREELEQIIRSNEPVQVAALELTGSMLAQADISKTPTNDDLAPTEDIQITDEIKALAAQLEHHPVKIYNWVHNNIEYLPTYGSIQGSQLTLDNKRGNAFDTASLLIALLRASNIPARYAYGAVQIPIEKVMNWVGGVESPNAALDFMLQGGIPTSGLAQGGVIKFAKFEHIWVEAWVDYHPSKGAINKTGDSWVSMDASFKQYAYTQGMDIRNTVPFDTQELIDQVTQTAEVNEQENSITGIDQVLLQTTLESYRSQISTHIEQVNSNATIGDVIGNKTILTKEYPVLAMGLPYSLLNTAGNFAVIPAHLRHQIRFNFYASNLDQVLGSPSFSYQESLPKLSDQRVSFTYEPSTEADKAVLDTAFEGYQTQFAAYLVNMTPELKIKDQRVAGGGSYQVGTEQSLTVEIHTPWYSHKRNYGVTSGDSWVLGVNPAGITSQMFDKRVQTHDLSSGEHPEFISEMFHQIMLGYWGELNAFKDLIASTDEIRYQQLPSHGFAGASVSITYNFGIPRWATHQTRVLDVKENFMSVIHNRNDEGKTVNYGLKTGLVASYLESGIYDQAFLIEPGYSMSAVTALKKANEQSIPIYKINTDNLATVLPKLTVDSSIKSDINNSVNAGLEVLVSRDPITVANFTGAGYIITDPKTGSGSYRISGGREGDNTPSPKSVYPLPQVPATPIFGIMMRSTLRSAGATLATEAGILTGIVLAPEIATAATILAAIIVALMLITTIIDAIDELFPKIHREFRHYTNAASAILFSGLIRQTRDGTFGDGIYVADRQDEIFNYNGGQCPPNSLDIVTRFQIPRPGAEDPTRVNGYIDFEITRDNIYKIDSRMNQVGQIEHIIRSPIFPYEVNFQDGSIKVNWALYIGPWSIGINILNTCG